MENYVQYKSNVSLFVTWHSIYKNPNRFAELEGACTSDCSMCTILHSMHFCEITYYFFAKKMLCSHPKRQCACFCLVCVRFSNAVISSHFVNYLLFSNRNKMVHAFFIVMPSYYYMDKRLAQLLTRLFPRKHKKSIILLHFVPMSWYIKCIPYLYAEITTFVNDKEKNWEKKSIESRTSTLHAIDRTSDAILWIIFYQNWSNDWNSLIHTRATHIELWHSVIELLSRLSRHANECIVNNKLRECATLT